MPDTVVLAQDTTLVEDDLHFVQRILRDSGLDLGDVAGIPTDTLDDALVARKCELLSLLDEPHCENASQYAHDIMGIARVISRINLHGPACLLNANSGE